MEKVSSKTVFLGGTCNGSKWREALIPLLNINYFNPVVPDWNEEAYQKELKAREESEVVLYYITPAMTGVYSIAEAVDDSNKRPTKTVFYFDSEDGGFDKHQVKSLVATGKMIEKNGAYWAKTYDELINFLNK